MTRMCPSPQSSGLHGRPRSIRRGAATAMFLLVFFSKTPVADTFVISRSSKAPLLPVTSCSSANPRTNEAAHSFAHDTHLYRRISTRDDDDDMGEDWRELKRSVKNLAKKAGKKLTSVLKDGAKALKQGGKDLVKSISPVEEKKEAELIEDYPTRGRAQPDTVTERDMSDINGELDVLGRGGLTDLFFGVPDYFSPGGPLVNRLFGGRDGLLSVDFTEQDQMVEDVLEEARVVLQGDSTVKSLLGAPLEVNRPHSQESRTSSLNGKSKTTMVAKFGVLGPNAAGTASVSAVDGTIESMSLDVDGWTQSIPVRRAWWGGKTPKTQRSKGDVIEAEVVKKAD